MLTHIIEATNHSEENWGKFMLMRFSTEWEYRSQLPGAGGRLLLRSNGIPPGSLIVLDLQTGEGANFQPRPEASVGYDLDNHRIWVCPMFEPFLHWLYQQNLDDITKLPAFVKLDRESDKFFAIAGYRRPGPIDGTIAMMEFQLPRLIQEFYDDPDGVLSIREEDEAFPAAVRDYLAQLQQVAIEVCVDFEATVKAEASTFEVKRIARALKRLNTGAKGRKQQNK